MEEEEAAMACEGAGARTLRRPTAAATARGGGGTLHRTSVLHILIIHLAFPALLHPSIACSRPPPSPAAWSRVRRAMHPSPPLSSHRASSPHPGGSLKCCSGTHWPLKADAPLEKKKEKRKRTPRCYCQFILQGCMLIAPRPEHSNLRPLKIPERCNLPSFRG